MVSNDDFSKYSDLTVTIGSSSTIVVYEAVCRFLRCLSLTLRPHLGLHDVNNHVPLFLLLLRCVGNGRRRSRANRTSGSVAVFSLERRAQPAAKTAPKASVYFPTAASVSTATLKTARKPAAKKPDANTAPAADTNKSTP